MPTRLGRDRPTSTVRAQDPRRFTDQVKLEGNRRRGQRATGALDLVVAEAEPSERPQLTKALQRLHELLVEPHAGQQVRVLASEER